MVRVLFVCRQLRAGGAERQLLELAGGLDKRVFAPTIVTSYDGGELHRAAAQIPGVKLLSLGKRGRWDVPRFLARFAKLCLAERPNIVHGYLSIANELALIAGRITGAKTVWGIRASNMDLREYDWAIQSAFRIGAVLSRFPDRIVINSEAGRRHYIAAGYESSRMVVIHNGIDAERFRPDTELRSRMRRHWNVDDDTPVIGIVARMDPMKDHRTFLQAAAIVARRDASCRFVCVGGGPMPLREELMVLAADLGIKERVIWTGFRDDMADVYNAFDIAVSSSAWGEGFSNAIGEAMSCGVPCAVTDVGDSATIVGETGLAVPPSHPQALAEAVQQLLALGETERRRQSAAARERITQHFSVAHLVAKTQRVFLELTA